MKTIIVLFVSLFLSMSNAKSLKQSEMAQQWAYKIGYSKNIKSFVQKTVSKKDQKEVFEFIKTTKTDLNQKIPRVQLSGAVLTVYDVNVDFSIINDKFIKLNGKSVHLNDQKKFKDYYVEIEKILGVQKASFFSIFPQAVAEGNYRDRVALASLIFGIANDIKNRRDNSSYNLPENYLIGILGKDFSGRIECASEDDGFKMPKVKSFNIGSMELDFGYNGSDKAVITDVQKVLQPPGSNSCYNFNVETRNGRQYCQVNYLNDKSQKDVACTNMRESDPLANANNNGGDCTDFLRALQSCCDDSSRCIKKIHVYNSIDDEGLVPPPANAEDSIRSGKSTR